MLYLDKNIDVSSHFYESLAEERREKVLHRASVMGGAAVRAAQCCTHRNGPYKLSAYLYLKSSTKPFREISCFTYVSSTSS